MTPITPTWATPAAALAGGGVALAPSDYLASVPMDSFIRVCDMPGTFNSACLALSRAVKKGELARVAKGVYYKGAKTRYGAAAPYPDWVVLELMGHRGVGPTGWSAASSLGLTTQVPPKTFLATVLRPPAGFPTIKFVRRNNPARLDLTHVEISLLELFRDWRFTSDRGWPPIVRVTKELIADQRIRIDSILGAAGWEHNAATKKAAEELRKDLGLDAPVTRAAR